MSQNGMQTDLIQTNAKYLTRRGVKYPLFFLSFFSISLALFTERATLMKLKGDDSFDNGEKIMTLRKYFMWIWLEIIAIAGLSFTLGYYWRH